MNRTLNVQIWHDKRLRASDKLVALALAQLCRWDADTCSASLRYLSAMTGLTADAVHRHVLALESMGILTRYQRHRRAPTEYTLHTAR